jgi:hypothetical protein
MDGCREAVIEWLPEFLTSICIDPHRQVPGPGERYDGCNERFENITGALYEFQEAQRKRKSEGFAETEVSQKVDAALDRALTSGRITVIEGVEGVGKSIAVQAWCRRHQGEARYVALTALCTKTTFFAAISRALGLGSNYGRKTVDMQTRIEETLRRSRLLLVIDEAHQMLPSGGRFYTPPVLLDWLYTGLTNNNVPCALICTPIWGRRLEKAEKQTVWNSGQFARRVRHYVPLPARLSQEDLERVAT